VPYQVALTIAAPVRAGAENDLNRVLESMGDGVANGSVVDFSAFSGVHFARFVLLRRERLHVDRDFLGVFTTFDGDFEDYLLAFVERVGEVFDLLLSFVEGAENVIPVRHNPNLFVEYVREHDVGFLGDFYSAYPNMGVIDIRRATRPVR
jgi:hypothetical protein